MNFSNTTYAIKKSRWLATSVALFLTAISVVSSFAAPPTEPFPAKLVVFKPMEGNPVFTGAGEGHWDAKIRERGWIIREAHGWKMWYTGYDGTRAGKKMLGYATSDDGFHWKRYSDKPIYSESWVEDVCVIPNDGTYYMFAESEQDRAYLLTSKDGIHWERIGTIDVRMKNGEPIEDGPFGTPTAWYENGTWNLFYERRDVGIWLARSTDLKVFTNVQDEPVMVPGPDEFDHDQIAMNQIIRYQDHYYCVFHGAKNTAEPSQPRLWATGIAKSSDLIHWTKYQQNPLRPIAENKSSGLLIPHGENFLLYTMHNQVDVHPNPAGK